jgi:hypothetical protein
MPLVPCTSSILGTRCWCIDTKVPLEGVVSRLFREMCVEGCRRFGYKSPNSRARATASVRL